VQKTLAVARALITDYERLRHALALFLLNTAKPPEAQTLDLFQTGPGSGNILRRVLRDAIPQSERFPRGQDVAAYWRLGKWAKAAGGKRVGTSGAQSGNAHLTWAFSAAAPPVPARQRVRTKVSGPVGEAAGERPSVA
jgi:transposase